MKQTAVEWMIEEVQELRENGDTDLRAVLYRLTKAKEIEKQQIINARLDIGLYKGLSYNEALLEAESYYNKTFNE